MRKIIFIRIVICLLVPLFLFSCTSLKIKVIDAKTNEPIEQAFVYVKPMRVLPFALDDLNFILLSNGKGEVDLSVSSFYIYAGKEGYGISNKYEYDDNKDEYLVFLHKNQTVKSILFNGTENDFNTLKQKEEIWNRFQKYCNSIDVKIYFLNSMQ